MKPPLASREQVAEYLGLPSKTLAKWAYEGTGPAYVRVGRYARYRWEDVERWLEEQQVPATSRGGGAA